MNIARISSANRLLPFSLSGGLPGGVPRTAVPDSCAFILGPMYSERHCYRYRESILFASTKPPRPRAVGLQRWQNQK